MGMLPGPMAQDEEGDFVLGEKLLKKPKRIRTRVDAGEPRNPYSAFGAFPNLCGVSVNGSGGGVGGGAVRTSAAALAAAAAAAAPNGTGAAAAAGSLFGASAPSSFCGLPFVSYLSPQSGFGGRGMLSELFGGGAKAMVSCPPDERASMGVLDKTNDAAMRAAPDAENVLLREILQGRKRDLLTMEDLEAARSLHNNNYKGGGDQDELSGRSTNSATALTAASSEDETRGGESEGEEAASPGSDGDPKKARLETIVSVIRSSPTPPAPVNGCKKRKLYLPQQHEARAQVESPGAEGGGGSPASSAEPEHKARRLEDAGAPASPQQEDRGLQIDLSVRGGEERGARRSPPEAAATPPRASASPKGPPEPPEPASYLLDYAKQLFRSQGLPPQPQQEPGGPGKASAELSEKLSLLRSFSLNSQVTELIEGLADVLKTEITASLAVIIDSIVNKYVTQRRLLTKHAEAAAEQLNRDIASHLIERSRSRSPRSNPLHNPSNNNTSSNNNNSSSHNHNSSSGGNPKERSGSANPLPRINGIPPSHGALNLTPYGPSENNLNSLNLPHLRPNLHKGAHGFFQGNLSSAGGGVPLGQTSPYAALPPEPEQDEALSLVVTPKKKRHKVTDSRLTPRTVGRLLEDLPRYPHMPPLGGGSISPRGSPPPHGLMHPQAPPRPSFPQPPPPLLPVSLPTSVAIPNPSLHDTGLLYPTYYRGASSPSEPRREESPASHPPPHHHPLLHPALLAASSPDSFSHFLRGAEHDSTSDCSPADNHYEGVQPPISFYGERKYWCTFLTRQQLFARTTPPPVSPDGVDIFCVGFVMLC